METSFIKWTEALKDHFFSRDSQEEVFLYVDEQILDKIGNDNGLGDHNCFLNTVLVDIGDRIDLYDKLYFHINRFQPRRTPAENRKLTSSSILKFASFLGDKITGDQFYFPYVVLVMYYASQTAKRNDQAIGRYIKEQLGITNYDPIIDLFNRLNKDYPRFRNESRTRQRIIGLIKYQLLLSPSEIREINEALYRILYKDDFTLTYLDKIRRIKDYVIDDVKSILSMSLSNSDYQYRINSLFEDFDLESYKNEIHSRSINNNNTEFAALYLDFSNGRGFRLLSTYRPEEEKTLVQEGNTFTFSPSIDSIDIYNNVFVRYNNDEFVDLGDYSIRSDDLVIKPIALGHAAFFFKCGNGTYLQSIYHYYRKVYVFIKKDRQNKYINQWEEWADQHARNYKRIDEEYDVSDLTKNNWALYSADGLDAQYGDIAGDGWDTENKVRSIVKRGGIRCPNEKNVYLINALPYFEFPEIINEPGLDLTIKEDDKDLEESTDYRYFIQENRLIVDLLKEINYEESRKISIIIKYSDPITQEDLSTEDYPNGSIDFSVRGQRINYNQDALYSFDRWGEKTDNSDCKIQGNIVTGVNINSLGRAAHVIDGAQNFTDSSKDYFYFINLIASCVYMEPSGQITRDRLEQCISYAAMRLNLKTNDDGFVPKTISMLINCGYLAANYNTRHYQTIPPAFIKIPRSFNVGGNQTWMLIGAYTRRFLTDLLSFCRDKDTAIRLRYSKILDKSRNSLRLLPPIILLDGVFKPNLFKSECPHHNFDILQDGDQSLNILSLIHSISEYRKTLEIIPRETIEFSRYRTKSNEYPKIWEDNPYAYNNHIYIEDSKGAVFKPSISHGWNHLFCFYEKDNPFIIKDTQHIYINTDLHLPSLIQRSLFIMNVGLPSYKKVFICGNSSRQLYTIMKAYNVNNDRRKQLFKTLTGVDNVDENQFIRERVKSSINNRRENWAYHMELWIKKEEEGLNNRIPDKLLVLRHEDNRYRATQNIAISTLYQNRRGYTQKNYVLIRKRFLEVDSNCNETMTFIIKNPHWTYDKIPLAENPGDFTLPERDKYDIEEITIL